MDRLQGRVVFDAATIAMNIVIQLEIGLTLATGVAMRHAVVKTPQLFRVLDPSSALWPVRRRREII